MSKYWNLYAEYIESNSKNEQELIMCRVPNDIHKKLIIASADAILEKRKLRSWNVGFTPEEGKIVRNANVIKKYENSRITKGNLRYG